MTTILISIIEDVRRTRDAVARHDQRTGDPWVYKIRCRDMRDALDDLRLEIWESYDGLLRVGHLVLVADNEGDICLREWGPAPVAFREAYTCPN